MLSENVAAAGETFLEVVHDLTGTFFNLLSV
jgi:hypothetical protein